MLPKEAMKLITALYIKIRLKFDGHFIISILHLLYVIECHFCCGLDRLFLFLD
jgi:hypothetical protein